MPGKEREFTMAQPKGLAAVDLAAKRSDLRDINSMHAAFGDTVYPVLRKQYLGLGYQAGVERMTRLVAAGYVNLLMDLFPGLIVNYFNKDSRRHGSGHDCVEAFQVIAHR